MNMIAMDLSGIPRDAVRAGMWMEIFGPNAPVERVAEQARTIPNKILTGIGPRMERVYVRAIPRGSRSLHPTVGNPRRSG